MFIINSLCGGGAEMVMSTLLAHAELKRRHYDISLVLLDEEETVFPPPNWVKVHRLDCGFSTWASVMRLRALVAKEAPDLTFSFLTRSNVANAIAMGGRGKPFLISERINTSNQLGGGVRSIASKLIVRMTYPKATAVVAVSRGVAHGLSQHFRVPENKIKVIHNPVDLAGIRRRAKAPNPFSDKAPYILALGRQVEKKNIALLLRAFARSSFAGNLVIAGDGPKRGELVSLVESLSIANRVFFVGFLANPFPALAGAQLFALSSNAEGFPNALVEALSLGIPVVATNCRDGPAEILAGKLVEEVRGCEIAEAGVLTPINDVDSFVGALSAAFRPDVRERIIANGLARAQSYSLDASLSAYWSLIEQALASQPA